MLPICEHLISSITNAIHAAHNYRRAAILKAMRGRDQEKRKYISATGIFFNNSLIKEEKDK
jgi:hypothetical protein